MPIRSKSCLAVRLTHHFCCGRVQVVVSVLALGVSGLLQQFRHIRPELPPRLLFLGRQFLDRLRVTNTGQVGVALPVLECGPHDLAIFWLAAFKSFGPLLKVSPQPGERLLAQPPVLLVVEFVGVRTLTGRGQERRSRRRYNDGQLSGRQPVSGRRVTASA